MEMQRKLLTLMAALALLAVHQASAQTDDEDGATGAASAQTAAEVAEEGDAVEGEADEAELADEDEPKEVTWEQISIEHERIVRAYVGAAVSISLAQAELAEALELKKQAAIARAEAEALESNTTVGKSDLQQHTKTSKKTNELIQKKLEEDQELSEEQRVQFTSGMVSYVLAVEQTHQVVREAKPFVQSVKSKTGTMFTKIRNTGATIKDKPLQAFRFGRKKNKDAGSDAAESVGVGEMKSKMATGLYIGTKSPGLVTNHGKTLGQVSKYMQDNDLAVPPEATQAMTRMQGSEELAGVF